MLRLMLPWTDLSAKDLHSTAMPWLTLVPTHQSFWCLHRIPSLLCCWWVPSLLRHRFGNVGTLLREVKQKPGCSMGLDSSLVRNSPVLRFWAQFYLVILQTSPEQPPVLLYTSKGNETLHV